MGAALVAPAVTNAANPDIVVNSDADTNDPGTLRRAINDANAATGADTITFDSGLSGHTIHLLNSLPTITDDLTITGPGADTLTLDGSGIPNGRIMKAQAAYPGPSGSLDLSGLTFSGGSYPGSYGGAIGTFNVDLTVGHSVFSNNSAGGNGGAISSTLGSLTMSYTDLTDNRAGNNGGGAYAFQAPLALSRSTVTGNSARLGGGISTWETADNIQQSTVSGNHATTTGGGLDLGGYGYYGVYLSNVANTTVTGNTAGTQGGGVYSYGGSSYYYAPTNAQLAVRSSTIAGNHATGAGGGIAVVGNSYGYASTLSNDVVGCNATEALSGADLFAGTGETPFAVDFSLIQNAPASMFTESVSGSNIVGQNPQLAALADNGGFAGGHTETRSLAANSPAIDKGSTSLATDQRGENRQIDQPAPDSIAPGADKSDMGAFEVQNADTPQAAAACDSHVGVAPATPPPVTTPPPVVPQQPASIGHVAIKGIKARNNGVAFTVTCTVGACNGRGVLNVVEKLNGRRIIGLQKKLKRKRVRVGAKGYALTAGQTKTITVKLNGKGRKLLRRFKKMPVKLVVSQKQSTGKSQVVKSEKLRIRAGKRKRR
jgi:predicted outer membrane repeat protein